jgi:hypothetical protein
LALKKVFGTITKQSTLLADMEIYTIVGYGLGGFDYSYCIKSAFKTDDDFG